MALFRDLASNAIFTVLSFLTVTTTGWMKTSSLIFSTLPMWASCSNLSIYASTASWSCSGIHLPFCWVIFAPFLNSHLILYPFIFPCLLKSLGTFSFNFLMSCSSEMFCIMLEYSLLPFASPTPKFDWLSQSRPMRDRFPSFVITILAFSMFFFPP